MNKALGFLLAGIAVLALKARAQTFVNLDFEQARLPDPPPDPVMSLAWSAAVPGWSHSDGDSTAFVYYNSGHVGFSQWYALIDGRGPDGPVAMPFGAASGSYALRMRSGTYFEHEPRGSLSMPFLSQTGTVPAGARSLSLLASDFRFGLYLDQTRIEMRPVGLDPASPSFSQELAMYSGEWTGDITAFAGSVVTLTIRDEITAFEPLTVDEIRFLPIPEPSTTALIGVGAPALLLAAWLRRRARAAASRCASGSAAAPRV